MQLHDTAEKRLRQDHRSACNVALQIRRAFWEDIPDIAALSIKTFQDTYGPYNDPKTLADYLTASFSAGKIAAEMERPTSVFLLAFQGGVPIGYARMEVDSLPDDINGPRPIRLFRLYLDLRYTGCGRGAALLNACLEEARQKGFQTLWLGVWEQNERAQRFYRRQGFLAAGFQDFILGREIQRDVLMARAIEPLLPEKKDDAHA